MRVDGPSGKRPIGYAYSSRQVDDAANQQLPMLRLYCSCELGSIQKEIDYLQESSNVALQQTLEEAEVLNKKCDEQKEEIAALNQQLSESKKRQDDLLKEYKEVKKIIASLSSNDNTMKKSNSSSSAGSLVSMAFHSLEPSHNSLASKFSLRRPSSSTTLTTGSSSTCSNIRKSASHQSLASVFSLKRPQMVETNSTCSTLSQTINHPKRTMSQQSLSSMSSFIKRPSPIHRSYSTSEESSQLSHPSSDSSHRSGPNSSWGSIPAKKLSHTDSNPNPSVTLTYQHSQQQQQQQQDHLDIKSKSQNLPSQNDEALISEMNALLLKLKTREEEISSLEDVVNSNMQIIKELHLKVVEEEER